MTKIPADILQRAHQLEADSPLAMVAVFTPAGDYLYSSANHEQYLGYTAAELAKLKLAQLVAPEDLEHMRLGFMDTVLHGKSVVISVHLVAKSGSMVPVKSQAWHMLDRQTGQGYMVGRATPSEARAEPDSK